ncbi:MAG: hypothetical protein GEU99_10120 [Luteitalea sp.]|nr:hypothetical protein [Luteitalea sp.]
MKAKLRRGDVVIGALNNLQAPALIELLGLVALDYVIIDAEHTAITAESAEGLYRAAELRHLPAITRVGENSPQVVQKFMDAGSMGIMMPMVTTPAEVQHVVDAVKYPPLGKRGLAASRASNWYLTASPADYVRLANEETFVAIQIETREAIDNFDALVDHDQVDAVFFGPSDISAALGVHGQLRHPDVVRIIERLGRKAIARGKVAGTLALELEDYTRYRAMGFLWFATVIHQLVLRGVRGYLQELHAHERGREPAK